MLFKCGMYCKQFLMNAIIKKHITSTIKRENHVLEMLKERTLLQVSGNEVSDFLQGLITNDIRHISNVQGSMFTMFLNTKGRVLCDAIIYNSTVGNDMFYVECDQQIAESLQKHVKLYGVRRKIDVIPLDKFKIYASFNSNNAFDIEFKDLYSSKLDGSIVPCEKINEGRVTKKVEFLGNLQIYADPRNVYLGSRIIAPGNENVSEEIANNYNITLSSNPTANYRTFRYYLGVGEGVIDLPPGNCFPLEANCDYLHGISFHKGCYIGQELTARTYHTGVIRKRLMPLKFSSDVTKLPEDENIMHDGKRLGKLRGVEGNVGLGLLRISNALDIGEIKIGNGIAKTYKPKWWPLEMPKEKNIEHSS